MAKKSAKMMYGSFLKHIKSLDLNGGDYLEVVGAEGVLFIHDLRRVWWLYYLLHNSGFIDSIRAAYMPDEIETIFRKPGINRYEIKRPFPYFM